MAFSDPQTVTYNGSPVELNRMFTSGRNTQYASPDNGLTLDIQHQVVRGREQSLVKLTHRKVTSDPLIPSNNRPYNVSVHAVINRPLDVGYSDAEVTLVFEALVAYLGGATVKGKLLNGES